MNVDDLTPAELPPTQHIPADQVIRQLSAFGQDENCELYMVNRDTNTLYRFTDSEFMFRGGFESPVCR